MENVIMSNLSEQTGPSNNRLQPASEQIPSRSPQARPGMLWTGRALSSLYVLFMLGASVTPKILQLPVAEASMAELG